MNMSSMQLKHNGFYPIKNIDKNIPVDIAKKFCKNFHITIGKSVVKKHITKSNVVLSKFKS